MARAPATTTARRWKLPSFENTSFALVFLVAPVLGTHLLIPALAVTVLAPLLLTRRTKAEREPD